MTHEPEPVHDIGIGAAADLNLRVSAANLVKITFNQPHDLRVKLVLERTGTGRVDHERFTVLVRAKPFGGGLRINDPGALRAEVGEFRFDSHRSQVERDFRIFINPNDWESLKQFCWQHLRKPGEVLESSPQRELVEEFRDALKIGIDPQHYKVEWSRMVVEDEPIRTGNSQSAGIPTVRIYSIHAVKILDSGIVEAMKWDSTSRSDQDLIQEAERDYLEGGQGRSNAILVLDFDHLLAAYRGLSGQDRNQPTRYRGHDLEPNVLAIMDEIETHRYQCFHFSDQG